MEEQSLIIFVDLGVVIFAVLLIALALVNSAAQLILKILAIICILLVIKNLIQDIYFGIFKRHRNPIISGMLCAVNIARVYVFYKLIYAYAYNTQNTTGFTFISRLIDFVIIILVGGAFFVIGELGAMYSVTEQFEDDSGSCSFASIVFTVLLFLLYFLFP